jgi:hypothetical protein
VGVIKRERGKGGVGERSEGQQVRDLGSGEWGGSQPACVKPVSQHEEAERAGTSEGSKGSKEESDREAEEAARARARKREVAPSSK